MNAFHGLTWEFTSRSSSVDFMDLTISIDDGKIHTTLFEKAMNLYLHLRGRKCSGIMQPQNSIFGAF